MYNGNGFHQQKFTAVAMTPDEFQAWVQQGSRTAAYRWMRSTLQLISKRTTRAQLIAALGQSRPSDGNVYFTGATAALFPAVVMATMDGTAVPAAGLRP